MTINQLPTLPTANGTEVIPVSKNGADYKATVGSLVGFSGAWVFSTLDSGTYGSIELMANKTIKLAIAIWRGNGTTPPANTTVTASLGTNEAAIGGLTNALRNAQYISLRGSDGVSSTTQITVFLNNVAWSGGTLVFPLA